MQKTARSPEELCGLCADFFQTYMTAHNRCLLLLEGNLGSGKTAFVRCLGKILGIAEKIQSPTFNLLNIHTGKLGKLYHYDLYRIQNPAQIEFLGFPEFWEQTEPSGIVVHAIEWWQKAGDMIPNSEDVFLIKLEYNLDDDDGLRFLTIYGFKS